ncbi:MAG: AgmX/PglI C-terminal domain-containing protein [Polyangiaceae bacterium]|nr:AgmX/PglI C-terminal domain-containing protein [Polyangiaceae bacterium]
MSPIRTAVAGVWLASATRLGACSPALPSEAPVTQPVPATADAAIADAAPPAVEAEAATPEAATALDAPADAPPVEDAGPGAEARVEIETPYSTWARPRPKGDVAAGAHDELIGRWNLGGTSDPTFLSNRPGFHPGTRVKVDTRVVGGRLPKSAPLDRRTGKHLVVLSETSLLVRARKHGYWPYRTCFERGVQKSGKLGGGETVLRFSVDRSGRIGPPRVTHTKLEAPEVVSCLREQTGRLPLLPPPKRVEVELSVQVWPGDAPLPSLDPVPTDPALALPVDSKALASALEGERSAIAGCYAAGLGRDPGLWGRLQLHVDLDAHGRVKRAREAESRFPDPVATACVVERVKALRLPVRAGHATAFELAFRLGRLPERPAAATP